MNGTAQELPLLRFRNGDDDDYFEKPVSIVGKIVGLDVDTVTIAQGRDMTTELYLDDLEPVLGGFDLTMSVLLDAAENDDVVKIALTPERVTYDNEAQLARATA